MSEPAGRILGCDGAEGGPDRRAVVVEGPGSGRTEERLHLREGFLDRIEIRGVARQEPETGPARFDRRPDRLAVVLAQVIHDHDLARLECRPQDVLHLDLESTTGHRFVQNQPGRQPLQCQGGQGGAIEAAIAGHLGVGALTAW